MAFGDLVRDASARLRRQARRQVFDLPATRSTTGRCTGGGRRSPAPAVGGFVVVGIRVVEAFVAGTDSGHSIQAGVGRGQEIVAQVSSLRQAGCTTS